MRTKKHATKVRRCRSTPLVDLSRKLLTVCVVFGFVGLAAFGQAPAPSATPASADTTSPSKADVTAQDEDSKKDDAPKKPKRGSLIIAPIPITSPTFGAGLILGVGYVFKLRPKDELSPASSIGVATAFTSSGSRGLVVGGRFHFNQNKYQAGFGIGSGRARYDFYGIGRVPGREPVSRKCDSPARSSLANSCATSERRSSSDRGTNIENCRLNWAAR